jgi:hypothetical protein
LVVLATAANLRSIELGNPLPPSYRLRIQLQGPPWPERRFQAQQSLARWIGPRWIGKSLICWRKIFGVRV